ncbi:MAG: efflux RND transporter permease subunit [Cyanobacteria bacterium HKST-UBA06]|nr:efflux RND transporter permease subunit [Cyanobacteria bacterium HKST-UBA06]
MQLPELSIRRPVLATVMSLILLLLGGISYFNLPVREYPDIEFPVVSVATVYIGASPETVETSVTEPLEEVLSTVEGLKTLTSSSKEEISEITLEFDLDKDVDIAAQDVRDRVARVRGTLPEDVEDPIVSKLDADAQAIIWLALYADKHAKTQYSLLQLSDIADRQIKDVLQTVRGVGQVYIGGNREYAMRVWIDPQKLSGRGLAISDVEATLRNNNIELPSGRVEGQFVEFTVRTEGELVKPEAFGQLVIRQTDSGPVYLRDVARVEVGAKDYRTQVRFNGQPAIGLGIIKQSKSNTLEVARGVKDKLADIRRLLPAGVNITEGYDGSVFIERSINEVQQNLVFAALLVILVIYAFLKNTRSALIPALSIPISVIFTFAMMAALNFTINTFTLLALTLAIGLVVDDTIIMLENIYRYIEQGLNPIEAGIRGSREIIFAVISTTVTLVSVFLPIGFVSGTLGRLFFEFALTMSGAVITSSFVALTLAPMLSARWLRKPDATTSRRRPRPVYMGWWGRLVGVWQRLDAWARSLADRYANSLDWALTHPRWVIGVSVIFVLVGFSTLKFLPSNFLPIEDRGTIVTIIRSPEGSTMELTDKALRKAEAIYASLPETERYFSVIGLSRNGPGRVNEALMFTALKPWEARSVKQQDIVAGLFGRMFTEIPEAFTLPINTPSGPVHNFNPPLQFVLKGQSIPQLYENAQKILEGLAKVPGVIRPDSNLKLDKPQIRVDLLREQMARLGLTVRDVSRALQILLGSQEVTSFKVGSRTYDVMVQAEQAYRDTPQSIYGIQIKNGQGNLIPLANAVQITETVGPKEINHYNRQRSATISGAVLPFISLGQAIDATRGIAQKVLPTTITTELAGESKEFEDTNNAFIGLFLLALMFVFLVLSAQFESFISPFIILLTVPLAVGGAFLSVFLIGASMNVYTQIGLVLLIGLVTKNGILIVEFANQNRQHRGMDRAKAVYEAARIRLRPIMMTSVTVVFGAIPLVLSAGPGAESRFPLGVVIIGGMLFSTFLTLFLIPVVYSLLAPETLEPQLEVD